MVNFIKIGTKLLVKCRWNGHLEYWSSRLQNWRKIGTFTSEPDVQLITWPSDENGIQFVLLGINPIKLKILWNYRNIFLLAWLVRKIITRITNAVAYHCKITDNVLLVLTDWVRINLCMTSQFSDNYEKNQLETPLETGWTTTVWGVVYKWRHAYCDIFWPSSPVVMHNCIKFPKVIKSTATTKSPTLSS